MVRPDIFNPVQLNSIQLSFINCWLNNISANNKPKQEYKLKPKNSRNTQKRNVEETKQKYNGNNEKINKEEVTGQNL
jgi:hypothetical protein